LNLALTYFPRLTDAQGKRYRTTWSKLVERLSVPRVCETKHEVPGLSLATYVGDRRALANVDLAYAIGLDFDKNVDWKALCVAFAESEAIIHTTWSSTPEEPRARAFLLISRPVTAAEYRVLFAYVAGIVEEAGITVDRAASDPSRFWYLPSVRPGGVFDSFVGTGAPMKVPAVVPVPPPSVPPPSSSRMRVAGSVEARAAAYLAKCGPAISGSGGHTTTFRVAQTLVRGFGLDDASAFRLLSQWNLTCSPPWSERDLRRKIQQAAERGTMPDGALRDVERRR